MYWYRTVLVLTLFVMTCIGTVLVLYGIIDVHECTVLVYTRTRIYILM